ncbi:aminodeoxychorismate lyase [Corynebacterium sp. P5848]|uniref:aminodeoxychorismate lyase n=1 Tax=Corynebacterium marambiense TaxID=2765364 RepID=UPI0022609E17|nr:aminodeoxychorismate lyase [Corynebacterium marambiense]MCX7543177.1 aminodeoxychorismate lyase [Corynebacterium marambiense]
MSSTRPSPVILIVEPSGGPTRRHNPELAMIYADDLGVTRGDGIFETLLVRDGAARNLDRHIDRFVGSARMIGLPVPDTAQWSQATAEAVTDWVDAGGDEAACVWTYTRGRESTGRPTGWITVKPVAEKILRQREEGVSVLTTPRGYSVTTTLPVRGAAGGQEPPPWLVTGAKTLNYAANMAALRYAAAKGFDDVIFTDDGRVLEGATSTVVTVTGRTLRTPPPGRDLLPGTTQAALFGYAAAHGWTCLEEDLDVTDLLAADSVWLCSSVRLAARVVRINDRKLPDTTDGAVIRELLTAALT